MSSEIIVYWFLDWLFGVEIDFCLKFCFFLLYESERYFSIIEFPHEFKLSLTIVENFIEVFKGF